MNGKDAIRAWLGDKPTLLGLVSLLVVMATEDVAEILKTWRKDRGFGRHLPKGDAKGSGVLCCKAPDVRRMVGLRPVGVGGR